jgi:hypothetical protein
MSAETGSGTESVTVYVRLLDEGTTVYRPTTGLLLGPLRAQLLAFADYDAEDENWEFKPGSVVALDRRILQGKKVYVAVELLEPPSVD